MKYKLQNLDINTNSNINMNIRNRGDIYQLIPDEHLPVASFIEQGNKINDEQNIHWTAVQATEYNEIDNSWTSFFSNKPAKTECYITVPFAKWVPSIKVRDQLEQLYTQLSNHGLPTRADEIHCILQHYYHDIDITRIVNGNTNLLINAIIGSQTLVADKIVNHPSITLEYLTTTLNWMDNDVNKHYVKRKNTNIWKQKSVIIRNKIIKKMEELNIYQPSAPPISIDLEEIEELNNYQPSAPPILLDL